MKQIALSLLLALALPMAAEAQCYAEYKAKQNNPLSLHYGILLLDQSPCPAGAEARAAVAARLQNTGWTLLNVLSTFATAPTDQQKANAGDYFLRY